MDFLINLLPHLVNGISLGLLFALIALGFMLIVGVMELINLAHGSLFALGAYLAMVIISPDPTWFGALGVWYVELPLTLRYILAIVFAPALVALVGMALEVCMRRTYGKDPLYGLLLTFGAALVLEELIRVFWGSSEQVLPVPSGVSGAFFFWRTDLFQLPLLRRRLRAGGHPIGLAVSRTHALRRHDQGRRPR